MVGLTQKQERFTSGGGGAIGPEADSGLDPAKRMSLRPGGGIRGLCCIIWGEHSSCRLT